VSALTRFVAEGAGALDCTEDRRTEQLVARLGRAIPSATVRRTELRRRV
jgi:hypothetical protein